MKKVMGYLMYGSIGAFLGWGARCMIVMFENPYVLNWFELGVGIVMTGSIALVGGQLLLCAIMFEWLKRKG